MSDSAASEPEPTVIDADEYRKAVENPDPAWVETVKQADEYLERVESAPYSRDRLVATIRGALEDHATPAGDPACTFCCGALAALNELAALVPDPPAAASRDYDAAWVTCPECSTYWRDNGWAIFHASASVGIERGLTTNQAARLYMEERHAAHA